MINKTEEQVSIINYKYYIFERIIDTSQALITPKSHIKKHTLNTNPTT